MFIEIIVIIMDKSSYLRIDNPDYPLGLINKKSIGIIGLGSGGSLISTYVTKSWHARKTNPDRWRHFVRTQYH